MAGTTNPKKPGKNGGGGQGSPTDITVWLDDATAKVLLSALTVALGKPTSGKKTKKVK